jgi:site-specific DNA recombinase
MSTAWENVNASDVTKSEAAILPWHNSTVSSAPWAPPQPAVNPLIPEMIPVAWVARTSDEEAQDPTLSLPRQLDRVRAVLPPGFVIVAKFYDVESGRKELDNRGNGTAHARFDIKIPRDGGVNDLLAEAKRSDRRFVAVVCESIDRVSRVTRIGTTIEYELERVGVALLAADEGISVESIPGLGAAGSSGRPKKATPVLNRRVKQAIAEWYVLNMIELSWDGFIQHTKQGWNIGKPPYGYRAEKVPHPVPARRAEGRTKHRLVPDPVRGPVVTSIFQMRALERLGYDNIADRLNLDLQLNPPPEPSDPARAVGRWTGSATREILCNPKYTGYMVWNRRRNPRKGRRDGKVNPPSEWTWSPIPVHEPLVTRELFDAASPVGRDRKGSRKGSDINTHPKTKRTYLLRSYVVHDLCQLRMFGKTRRRGGTYYACEPNPRHHISKAWFPQHPKSIWVREDDLAGAVHDFFATRVLGSDRRELLASDLCDDTGRGEHEDIQRQQAELQQQIDAVRRRQQNLIQQLEDPDDDEQLDPEVRRAFRQGIQRRFAELSTQLREIEAHREQLQAAAVPRKGQNLALLDALPQVALRLSSAPEQLQRDLYDAFNLKIIYSRERHEVTLRVTVTADAVDSLSRSVHAVADRRTTKTKNSESDAASRAHDAQPTVSLDLGAPGRIRTCATASGGRCSIP